MSKSGVRLYTLFIHTTPFMLAEYRDPGIFCQATKLTSDKKLRKLTEKLRENKGKEDTRTKPPAK